MATQDEARRIVEAQNQLARYLSDEIAPMIFAGDAEVLFKAPPAVMARAIHSWIGNQLQGAHPSPISDYLLHSARKVHHLGELELIPRDDLRTFMERLGPMLVSICPERDRVALATNLKQLDATESTGLAARISVGPSPSHDAGGSGGGHPGPAGPQSGAQAPPAAPGGGGSQAAEQFAPPPPAPDGRASQGSSAVAQAAAAADQTSAHIDRLNLLLDRWERIAAGSSDSPPAAALNASLAGAEGALLSRIIDEVASSARSASDLDNQLRYLGDVGVGSLGDGVFRALSGALPDWAPSQQPPLEGDDAPPLSGAAATMQKVMQLARDPSELNDRFRELISTAAAEFNAGSLGRCVTLIDLAQRMITKKEVEVSLAANIIDQTCDQLDENRLRKYTEDEERQLLLRRVLRFFPITDVDHLMDDLIVEDRRDRRRLILKLLMVHGGEARSRALRLLEESLSGNVPQPWYVQRNLIYLVRSIPPSEEHDIDKEIDLLVRASVPGFELPLIREALTALGQIDHPRAIQTLIARVTDLEDVLLQRGKSVYDPADIQTLLDTAIKALIRFNTKEARLCVVAHGLNRRPELGDTLTRLAMLGGQDLSDDPTTISRIIEAIKGELPVKVFGVAVKSSRRSQNIGHLLESLSGTDIPKVRMAYDSIVRKFPGEQFANAAARFLTKLDGKTSVDAPSADEGTITSLSGDLSLFGLPNLMQNLADSRVEGVLTVLDDQGNSTASISLSDGMMTDAAVGDLSGETAIYQLLERPVLGRFIFVNETVETGGAEDRAPGKAVMSLLMEGMRRYDEFNRAATIVADDGRFVATGKQPTSLADEEDPDFVNGIWVQATQGATAAAIEQGSKVDAYRIFRLLEHWVNEGSLEPKKEEPAAS